MASPLASPFDASPTYLSPTFAEFNASHSLSSIADMKFHLQSLLDNKEKQLQQAGMLGQRVLAQQTELEERIRLLQELEADAAAYHHPHPLQQQLPHAGPGAAAELEAEAQERYRELAETITTWDEENAQLSSVFGPKQAVNGAHTPPPAPLLHSEPPREEPERNKVAAAGTSASLSRRAKNAAHRADDVEFAFEIGSGLLTEVRRLQSLLAERDKAIQDMKEEKDDLEKSVDGLRTALRAQEQSTDKYKEENWNLEVALQDIRNQLGVTQASAQRLESEHKRLTKLLASSRDTGDQHKNEAEQLRTSLDALKAKHETDIAQARKVAAGLQRDKTDLQSNLDKLKAESGLAARRLPVLGAPVTPNGPGGGFMTPGGREDDDVFSVGGTAASLNRRKMDNSALFPPDPFASDYADSSPDVSPSKPLISPSHPRNEVEALQQRLAHAHRQINTLKGTLLREKELKLDYKKRLESSPGFKVTTDLSEEIDFVDVDDEEDNVTRRKPAHSPIKKIKTRARGGLSLLEMLTAPGLSEYLVDDDVPSSSDAPVLPPMPLKLGDSTDGDQVLDQEDVEEELQEDDTRSPSPTASLKGNNRVSVEGMDPVFANVLKRTGSASRSSSLRHAVVARQARRTRGGAAWATRPTSLVGHPEALADELGLGMGLLQDESIPEEDAVKETAEFGCQTEPVELPPPPPTPAPVLVEPVPVPAPPIHVSPPTTEMAVQADLMPLLEPEVVIVLPPISRFDMWAQTDAPPVVVRVDTAMQCEQEERPPLVVAPVLVSASMNTEPEEVPPVLMPVVAHAEVQTPAKEMCAAQTQTHVLAVVKVDMDTQTVGLPGVVAAALLRPKSREVPAAIKEDEEETDDEEPFNRERRTTLVPGNLSRTSTMTIKPQSPTTLKGFLAERRIPPQVDDGPETEPGEETEFETDMEDYHDARQSIRDTPTPTPSQSEDDFHSLMTMSDNEAPDSDEDNASIKASVIPGRVGSSVSGSIAARRESEYGRAPPVQYESKGVSVEPPEEPAKPVMKENAIQTDEWKPPAPVPPVVTPVTPTSGIGLYKVGSAGFQQFQFIAPPPPPATQTTSSTPLAPFVINPQSPAVRDSTATFGARPLSAQSDVTRQSIDSVVAQSTEDSSTRARVPSAGLAPPVDKTRPPTMALPPPPRLPPPRSMPPPSFIPEKRNAIVLEGSTSSLPPPPPEAHPRTTAAKGTYHQRLPVGPGMPNATPSLRHPASTSSFRSAANAAAAYAQHGQAALAIYDNARKEMSTTSLVSDRSSISSEHHRQYAARPKVPEVPVTPTKPSPSVPGSTDPTIIHAITQTMIGEFLWKYTRRTIGKGHGQTRHRRFFWVHPYTKTLYWSSADPGSSNVTESSAKSAYIEGVRSVLDPNPMPPGLHHYSVIISTPHREMKFTAATKERHDIWLDALNYLLARPSAPVPLAPNPIPVPDSPLSVRGDYTTDDENHRRIFGSPQSQRSMKSSRRGGNWTAPSTPRGQRSRSQISIGGSLGKRSGTPAAEYLRWAAPESPYSPNKSFEYAQNPDAEDLDFELHGEGASDEGFEGLENVRACCDGRHTVGPHHHHQHQQQQQQHQQQQHQHQHQPQHPPQQQTRTADRGVGEPHLEVQPSDAARPVSPAWSFRSRTASGNSHEGAPSMFSWGREEGRRRFGSRRSAKTTASTAQ